MSNYFTHNPILHSYDPSIGCTTVADRHDARVRDLSFISAVPRRESLSQLRQNVVEGVFVLFPKIMQRMQDSATETTGQRNTFSYLGVSVQGDKLNVSCYSILTGGETVYTFWPDSDNPNITRFMALRDPAGEDIMLFMDDQVQGWRANTVLQIAEGII